MHQLEQINSFIINKKLGFCLKVSIKGAFTICWLPLFKDNFQTLQVKLMTH